MYTTYMGLNIATSVFVTFSSFCTYLAVPLFYLKSVLHWINSYWYEFLSFDPFCVSISLQLCTSNHNNSHIYTQNPFGVYLSICAATPLSCRASIADLSKNILNVLVFQFNFLLAPQQQNLVESRSRPSFHNDSISYTWLPPPPDHIYMFDTEGSISSIPQKVMVEIQFRKGI